jgi:CDP-diacylglycerol--glycerol-3-phosphate 3-phosphatidyltransferase
LSAKNDASPKNLGFLSDAMIYSSNFGLVFLWLAAALTLISGFEYLQKSWPYLKG